MKEYDEKLNRKYTTLTELPAGYHHKKTPGGVTFAEGVKTNRRHVESKTQRQVRTLQRHRDRLMSGERVNFITIVDGNEYVILYGRQGKQPSFYGIHPPDQTTKLRGWFPVHPDDKNIPDVYKGPLIFPRSIPTGFPGEQSTQYDSDEDD